LDQLNKEKGKKAEESLFLKDLNHSFSTLSVTA